MSPSLERKLELVDYLYFHKKDTLNTAIEKVQQMTDQDFTISDTVLAQAEIVAQMCLQYGLNLQQGIQEVTSLVDYLQKKNLTENEATCYAAYCFGLRKNPGIPSWKFRFGRYSDYRDDLAEKAGFANDAERRNALAQKRGYASQTTYLVEMQRKRRARNKRKKEDT